MRSLAICSLAKNFGRLRTNCTRNVESIANIRTGNLRNLSYGETSFIRFATTSPTCTLSAEFEVAVVLIAAKLVGADKPPLAPAHVLDAARAPR